MTRPPSSPIRVNAAARPVISTSFAANRALKLNALPVRRLQARQWQTETRTGSPEQVAESCPHEHSARRVVMAAPLEIAPPLSRLARWPLDPDEAREIGRKSEAPSACSTGQPGT